MLLPENVAIYRQSYTEGFTVATTACLGYIQTVLSATDEIPQVQQFRLGLMQHLHAVMLSQLKQSELVVSAAGSSRSPSCIPTPPSARPTICRANLPPDSYPSSLFPYSLPCSSNMPTVTRLSWSDSTSLACSLSSNPSLSPGSHFSTPTLSMVRPVNPALLTPYFQTPKRALRTASEDDSTHSSANVAEKRNLVSRSRLENAPEKLTENGKESHRRKQCEIMPQVGMPEVVVPQLRCRRAAVPQTCMSEDHSRSPVSSRCAGSMQQLQNCMAQEQPANFAAADEHPKNLDTSNSERTPERRQSASKLWRPF